VPNPSRGEVWLVDLSPTRGHEQAGKRPGLIVSADLFNQGPAGLVVILPITTTARDIPFHVEISPPEGGLRKRSFVRCDNIRSISKERLSRCLGKISPTTILEVEARLRILQAL